MVAVEVHDRSVRVGRDILGQRSDDVARWEEGIVHRPPARHERAAIVPQRIPEPPHWEDGWPLIAPDPTQTAVNGVLVRRLEDELVIDGDRTIPRVHARHLRTLFAIIPFITHVVVEAATTPSMTISS